MTPSTSLFEIFNFPILNTIVEKFTYADKHIWYIQGFSGAVLIFMSLYMFTFILINIMYLSRTGSYKLVPKINEKPFLSIFILYFSVSSFFVTNHLFESGCFSCTTTKLHQEMAKSLANDGDFKEVYAIYPDYVPLNSHQLRDLETYTPKTYHIYSALAKAYESGYDDMIANLKKAEEFRNKSDMEYRKFEITSAKNGDITSLIEIAYNKKYANYFSAQKIVYLLNKIPKTCQNADRVYGKIGLIMRGNYNNDTIFTPWADNFSKTNCIQTYNEKIRREKSYNEN